MIFYVATATHWSLNDDEYFIAINYFLSKVNILFFQTQCNCTHHRLLYNVKITIHTQNKNVAYFIVISVLFWWSEIEHSIPLWCACKDKKLGCWQTFFYRELGRKYFRLYGIETHISLFCFLKFAVAAVSFTIFFKIYRFFLAN